MNRFLSALLSDPRVTRLRYKCGLYSMDALTRAFVRHNERTWRGASARKGAKSVILTDLFRPSQGHVVYSYFLNVLADRTSSRIVTYSKSDVYASPVVRRVYESFGAEEVVRPELTLEASRTEQAAWVEAARRSVSSKQTLFELKMAGLWVGIDIYETYLRVMRKPTVDTGDPALWQFVAEAAEAVVFWRAYFDRHEVKALVVSHDCYIYPGILCKIAYERKVPVYLPSLRAFYMADRMHTSTLPLYRRYPEMFARLPAEQQRAGREMARQQLERRFRGEVGVDMSYSTKSAYHSDNTSVPVLAASDRIKVLIASHCFFDNPHGYGDMLFVDFYEWLCYLGRLAERTDYDWYIKMHPDALPGTEDVIRDVLARCPRIKVVPQTTSHHQLVKEGIRFVLTVFGSVGHEYPAFGVQVITAGGNPRMAYSFNRHARTLEEYEAMLLNLGKLSPAIDLEELYEFYYMHHCYVIADDLFLDSYRSFVSSVSGKDQLGPLVYDHFMRQLSKEKHTRIIQRVDEFIASGKHYYFSNGAE